MVKKVVAILLALVMCMAFVACGSKNGSGDGGESKNPVQTPSVEDKGNGGTDIDADTGADAGTEGTEGETDVDTDTTVCKQLLNVFTANVGTMTIEDLANTIITNEIIQFAGGAMAVEPGYLSGFDVEITGFNNAVMMAPMIGTIPFVGYIFELEEGANVDEFEQMLLDNANMRWNICTSAEETVVYSVDNIVFFMMAPYRLGE